MNTHTYVVKGMHCASCSAVIEKTFKKVEGVHFAEVNYGTEKVKVSFDSTKTSPNELSKHIEPLGYSLEVPATAEMMGMSPSEHATHLGIDQSKKEKLAEVADMRKKVYSSIPLAVFASIMMGWDILAEYNLVLEMSYILKEFFHHLLPLFVTYVLFVIGQPYLLGL